MDSDSRFFLGPNRVSEVLLTKANLVSPAICYGRKSRANGVDENFILAFFLNCTDEQIETINSLIEPKENDVIIHFFKQRKDGSETKLSWDEKKSFDFSTPWTARKMVPTWDNKRNVILYVIGVFYY